MESSWEPAQVGGGGRGLARLASDTPGVGGEGVGRRSTLRLGTSSALPLLQQVRLEQPVVLPVSMRCNAMRCSALPFLALANLTCKLAPPEASTALPCKVAVGERSLRLIRCVASGSFSLLVSVCKFSLPAAAPLPPEMIRWPPLQRNKLQVMSLQQLKLGRPQQAGVEFVFCSRLSLARDKFPLGGH